MNISANKNILIVDILSIFQQQKVTAKNQRFQRHFAQYRNICNFRVWTTANVGILNWRSLQKSTSKSRRTSRCKSWKRDQKRWKIHFSETASRATDTPRKKEQQGIHTAKRRRGKYATREPNFEILFGHFVDLEKCCKFNLTNKDRSRYSRKRATFLDAIWQICRVLPFLRRACRSSGDGAGL